MYRRTLKLRLRLWQGRPRTLLRITPLSSRGPPSPWFTLVSHSAIRYCRSADYAARVTVKWREEGSTSSSASGINNCGQVVGVSEVGGSYYATEWSGGKIINLGGLPGSTYSSASGIINAGQVVGVSEVGGSYYATEWSGGREV